MTFPFKMNQLIELDNVAYRVDRQLGDGEVQIEHRSSGQYSLHQIRELLDAYQDGRLLIGGPQIARATHHLMKQHRHPVRLAGMSPKAKSRTLHRIEVMVRLDRMGSFEKGEAGLREDLAKIAAELGCEAEHPSTARRWRRRYYVMQKDVRAFFCQIHLRGGKGQSRLCREVEGIIFEKIDEVFLVSRRCTAEAVHDAVYLAIQDANTTRIQSEWLPVPSLRTIQRRISELPAFDRAVAEFGLKEAVRRFSTIGNSRAVRRILEIAEIDHSPVDCLVTDKDGVVIGRPTITVVLDRRSRCILGYHLSLAGHGVPAVFAALRHALMPKTYLRRAEAFRDLNLEWECFGWIEQLLADNGSEFHADAVRDALLTLGIAVEFAKSRSPNDKPFVERFLKTFNYSFIHRLPGTTLARVGDRKGIQSEKEACLTLTELDRLIHVWILEKYHTRPHGGLANRAPITVWREGAAEHPPQLKANMMDLDIEFANVAQRSLQHYGIDLNGFVYTSHELQKLRRLFKEGQRVEVKWPAADAGYIIVFDPFEHTSIRVLNKDPQYNGLTVEQAKCAFKAAAAGDPSYKYMGAKAGERIQAMVDAASKAKKLAGRKKGVKLANETSQDGRAEPAPQPKSDQPIDVATRIESMQVASSWNHATGDSEVHAHEEDA